MYNQLFNAIAFTPVCIRVPVRHGVTSFYYFFFKGNEKLYDVLSLIDTCERERKAEIFSRL